MKSYLILIVCGLFLNVQCANFQSFATDTPATTTTATTTGTTETTQTTATTTTTINKNSFAKIPKKVQIFIRPKFCATFCKKLLNKYIVSACANYKGSVKKRVCSKCRYKFMCNLKKKVLFFV